PSSYISEITNVRSMIGSFANHRTQAGFAYPSSAPRHISHPSGIGKLATTLRSLRHRLPNIAPETTSQSPYTNARTVAGSPTPRSFDIYFGSFFNRSGLS